MNPLWYFWIFWIFMLFFWNFILWVGYEWNGTIIFIFCLSRSFPTYFGLKWSHNDTFKFFEVFCYFFGIFFNAAGRKRVERQFLFTLSPPFPTCFSLKRTHNGIFWIFLQFFFNFLSCVGQERNGMIIFIFSLSQYFPTYFGLKWSRNRIF